MPVILTIRERSDSWAGRAPVSTAHPTRPDAMTELVAYVKRNWDAEIEDDRPADDVELVKRYFKEVLESYEITEAAG